jgi:hypothetical protein
MWKPLQAKLFLTEEEAINFLRARSAKMTSTRTYKITRHIAGKCQGPDLAGKECFRVFVAKHFAGRVFQGDSVGARVTWKVSGAGERNEVRFDYRPERIAF